MSKRDTHKASQSERFIEAARELACDEDEKAFDDKLRRIVPKAKAKEESPEK
ncbi:MAG: hypothetical protein HKM95_15465 [Inquilinus sp.]|nr:hypothetical protein [Inquilinus sp.]